jgi:hypothetical protein
MNRAGARLLTTPGRCDEARYRIETVRSQLAGQYNVKRTWAKDRWHFCHRVIDKILSHTARVLLTVRAGHRPLRLSAIAA